MRHKRFTVVSDLLKGVTMTSNIVNTKSIGLLSHALFEIYERTIAYGGNSKLVVS